MPWGEWWRKDWSQVVSEGARHILLGSGLILISIIVSRGLQGHAVDLSERWTKWLPYADTLSVQVTPLDTVALGGLGSPAELARFEQQMQRVASRANLHLQIMKYFYGRYFASVTMAALLAVAAGLCLFHITKAGWANANKYVMTLFVMSAGLAIFYQLSPRLYRQQDNISANKNLYLGYVALDDEIRTYLATGLLAETDSLRSLSSVLREVDARLLTLNDLPIGFDEAQVPDYSALPGLGESGT